MPESIKLSLKPEQLDYIANVLAQRPYVEVHGLIEEIRKQISNQPATQNEPDASSAG